MPKIDQFESVFKAAAKERFRFEQVSVSSVLVVTDLDRAGAGAFAESARGFLSVLGDEVSWDVVAGGDLGDVGEMLGRVAHDKPDLICTYRNLNSDAGKWRHSLGDWLDVLTQATPTPVLVLPRPDEQERLGGEGVGVGVAAGVEVGTKRVSVLTDHLTGDDRLISYGVHFTAAGGELLLTHVEDSGVFERYMQVISKIPEIDTERARLTILDQLLKEPRDYVESCAQVLEAAGIDRTVVSVVRLGHRLGEYLALIEEEEVGLVVLNTKDDDQLAMHGLAYPLAIELRHVPLLML